MKKLFGDLNISWKFLIIFSIIIGLIVGILNRIPLLNNTSFQDIAIWIDMWIILAIFIIVNCKNWKEAVLKCFVFFLISQPLIYFIEVIIDTIINGYIFKDTLILYFKNYYIGAGWLNKTFLTIPGAFIAYQIKKDNILASLILSLATSVLAGIGIYDILKSIFYNFPYHLLNGIICLIMAFLLIFIILSKKRDRIISLTITIIGLLVGLFMFYKEYSSPKYLDYIVELENDLIITDYNILDENIANGKLEGDGTFLIISTSNSFGNTKLIIKDNNNQEYIYDINVTNKELSVVLNK